MDYAQVLNVEAASGRTESERLQGGASGADQRSQGEGEEEEGGEQRSTSVFAGLMQSAFQVLGGGWPTQSRGNIIIRPEVF